MTEGVDALTFPMSRESESASRLKAIISDMLPRFSNHPIEDVLSEYITVLICNGKSQSQARKDLEAFLGEQSWEFVTCVWELLLKYFSQVKQGNSASEPNTAVEFGSHDTLIEQCLSYKEHDDYDHKATNATNSMNENLAAVTVPLEDIEAPVSPKDEKLKMLRQMLINSPCRRVQQKEKEDWNLPGLDYSRKTLHPVIVSSIKQPCGMNPDIYEKYSMDERSGVLQKCPFLPEREMCSQFVSSGGAVSARSHDAASHQERTPRVSVWKRLGKRSSNVVHDKVCPTVSKFGIDPYDNEVLKQHGLVFPVVGYQHGLVFPVVGYWHNNETITSTGPHTAYNFIRKRPYDTINPNSEDFSSVLRDKQVKQGFPRKKKKKQAKQNVEKPSLLSYQYTKPNIFSEIKNVKEKMEQLEFQIIQSKQLKKQKLEELKRSPVSLRFETANITPPCNLLYQEDVTESRIVHVTNVHFGAKKKAISALFSKCGAVKKVKIVTDPVTRQPKGTAIVTFATKESVNKAIAMSGTMFYYRPIKVWRHVIPSHVDEQDADVCNIGCFESSGSRKGRKRRLADWKKKVSANVETYWEDEQTEEGIIETYWEDEQTEEGIIQPNPHWVNLGMNLHEPLEDKIELLELNEKLSIELSLEKEKNKTLERESSEMMKQVRMLNSGTKVLETILKAGRVGNSKRGIGYSRKTTI